MSDIYILIGLSVLAIVAIIEIIIGYRVYEMSKEIRTHHDLINIGIRDRDLLTSRSAEYRHEIDILAKDSAKYQHEIDWLKNQQAALTDTSINRDIRYQDHLKKYEEQLAKLSLDVSALGDKLFGDKLIDISAKVQPKPKSYTWEFPGDESYTAKLIVGHSYLVIGSEIGLMIGENGKLISHESLWDGFRFMTMDGTYPFNKIYAFVELPSTRDVMDEVVERYAAPKSPEKKEDQMIARAIDMVEQQLINGTAEGGH